jgi:hypothetical protein
MIAPVAGVWWVEDGDLMQAVAEGGALALPSSSTTSAHAGGLCRALL